MISPFDAMMHTCSNQFQQLPEIALSWAGDLEQRDLGSANDWLKGDPKGYTFVSHKLEAPFSRKRYDDEVDVPRIIMPGGTAGLHLHDPSHTEHPSRFCDPCCGRGCRPHHGDGYLAHSGYGCSGRVRGQLATGRGWRAPSSRAIKHQCPAPRSNP